MRLVRQVDRVLTIETEDLSLPQNVISLECGTLANENVHCTGVLISP